MENKLTWVELKKAVARQTGLNEKEVNLILVKWLDEMALALKRGEELHIAGLGTFRMKAMKARKSVNVTTGEAIILPETDRLTFTMAAGLEEQLKDTASAKLAAGIDPIQKLSDQAEEILGILGEIDEMEPQPQPQPQPMPEEPAKPKKKERLWLTAGVTIVVFIGLLIGLFFFLQHKIEQWLTNLREQAEMVEIAENVTDNRLQVADTIAFIDTIAAVDTTETIETAHVNYREYTEFLGTEKMHQDSRLTWMAYRYYGNKQLWVFIYDANKDHLSSPQHIAVDTPIRIPKLSQEIIDLSTPELQALVQEMSDEFLGK